MKASYFYGSRAHELTSLRAHRYTNSSACELIAICVPQKVKNPEPRDQVFRIGINYRYAYHAQRPDRTHHLYE